MNWKFIWERHRVRISRVGGILLFLISHPRSRVLYGAGFILICAAEALRLWSAGHIRKGSALAHEGPYAMVRNPLYLGSVGLAGGFALMCTSWSHWISTAVIWSSLAATFCWLYAEKIALEEEDLASRFGDDFEAYRNRVPAMWPDFGLLRQAWESSAFSKSQLLRNKEHRTVLALLGLAILVRFKMIYRW